MNYGSNEGKEQNRARIREKKSCIKSWQTKWNGIFIIYNIYTGWLIPPYIRLALIPSGKASEERRAKQQKSNKIQTLGHSTPANTRSARITKPRMCIINNIFIFNSCIYCSCLFSIWHITPLFDRMLEICWRIGLSSLWFNSIGKYLWYGRLFDYLMRTKSVFVCLMRVCLKATVFKSHHSGWEFCIFRRK